MSRLKAKGLEFAASWDPELFYPYAAYCKRNGTKAVVNFDYSGGTIRGFLDSLAAASVFADSGEVFWIKGRAFLSSPSKTTIKIERFDPISEKNYVVNKRDGELALKEFCAPLADFKLKYIERKSLVAAGVPSEDGIIKIKATAGGERIVKISIFGLDGVVKKTFGGLPPRVGSAVLDASDLPSGMYFLAVYLESGTVLRQKIAIVK